MFDTVTLDPSREISLLIELINKVSRRKVADAFLSSLSTRQLDWRSALGSYAVFQHIQPHATEKIENRCRVCGFYLNEGVEKDLNVLNFERFKWGGVRHDDVVYATMDLGLFLKETIPEPTFNDIRIFREILSAIKAAPAKTSSANLHIQFAKVLKSNKSERDILVAILGLCGILGTPAHPGYSGEFIPAGDRILPQRRFVDMRYPACWWNADIGINQNWLSAYFGHVL
jgi:hypothetical protein